MLSPLRKFIDLAVQVGGWAFLAAALLVTYDVTTRKLFNITIAGADEISGYIFAVSTAFAFSYALLSRANIRIDVIYNLVPEAVQRVLDVLAILMTTGYLAFLCYFAYALPRDAIKYNSHSITPLQTPLAIPQVLWFGALVLCLVTAIILAVMALWALLRGRFDQVRDLVGVPSLTEEIETELHTHTADQNVKED